MNEAVISVYRNREMSVAGGGGQHHIRATHSLLPRLLPDCGVRAESD